MPFLPRPEKKDVPNFQTFKKVKFYATTVWRNVRAHQIALQPYCAACYEAGTLTDCSKGGIVDHIVRIEAGGAPLDLRNLWTLCKEHSARKTALERHGLTVDAFGDEGEKYPTHSAKRDILNKIK